MIPNQSYSSYEYNANYVSNIQDSDSDEDNPANIALVNVPVSQADKSPEKITCIPSSLFLYQDCLEELMCLIGHNVLNHPVSCPKCKAQYCIGCLHTWFKNHSTCPQCRASFYCKSAFEEDKKTWKIICSYKVKCSNLQCEWQGKYGDLQYHLSNDCGFSEVPCPKNCKASILRKDIKSHLEICKFFNLKCQHCHKTFKRFKIENHIAKDCPAVLVDCPNNCAAKVQRGLIIKHLDEACPETIKKCEYSISGCKFEGNKKNIEAHCKAEIEEHLKMTNNTLKKVLKYMKQVDAFKLSDEKNGNEEEKSAAKEGEKYKESSKHQHEEYEIMEMALFRNENRKKK